MKVLVIVPAYNEEQNILKTIRDIQKSGPESIQYLVINDCSTDKTKSVLRQAEANYLDLPINLGIGGGVQTGYRYALEYGVKAKLFCPEIAGLFCRIAGLFCHDSRANLSLKPMWSLARVSLKRRDFSQPVCAGWGLIFSVD